MRRTVFCADNSIATRHDVFYTFFSRPSIDTRALTNILYAITPLERYRSAAETQRPVIIIVVGVVIDGRSMR